MYFLPIAVIYRVSSDAVDYNDILYSPLHRFAQIEQRLSEWSA